MSHNTPVLLFDMDGVVLHDRSTDPSVYQHAVDAVAENHGLTLSSAQRTALAAHSYDEIEPICSRLDIEPAVFWEHRETQASRIENERIRAGKRALREDIEIFAQLAATTPLAIVSNNRHGTVTFVAEYFELPVETARGRDPTPAGYHRRKPDPSYLHDVLDQLETRQAIYVGDRKKDVLAAHRAGIEAAFLRQSGNQTVTLDPAPEYELTSLAELQAVIE